INYTIQPGTDYRLTKSNDFEDLRWRTGSSSPLPYPYEIGPSASLGNITAGGYGQDSPGGGTKRDYLYYFFYNWTVSTGSVQCESTPRTEIIATVNTNGDKQVPSTTTPSVYTDTDDTANFGDAYSGA